MSLNGLGGSPVLPAPPYPVRGSRGAAPWKQAGSQPASKQKLLKRKQITAVACQPCQQRKSKCDGLRPACSACQQKNRADCYYDMNGDQRRTAALKEKIKQLQDQGDELKEIIRIVCGASDREEALAIVKQLQQGNFRNSTEVLSLLKSKTPGLALDASYRVRQTIDPECDGEALFSPGSVSWVPSPQSPVFSTAEASWTPETLDQKWNPLSPYMASPSEAAVPTYAPSARSSFQAPSVGTSGRLSIENFNNPQTRNSSQPLQPNNQNQRYVKFASVTHVQCLANSSQPATPGGTTATELVPIYLLRPMPVTYNDLMSQRMQTFMEQKRRLIEDGWPIEQVLGPLNMYPTSSSYISMTDPQSLSLNVCEWVVSMMAWMNIDRQPERMAMMALGALFLTWAIVPSEENYQAMPVWMRPTPTQIIMPHPPWIDIVPWPEIRDFFIRFAETTHGMEVLQTFVSNISINWTLQLSDVTAAIPNTTFLALSQPFEAHTRNLDNWSLDPAVLLVYPDLAGMAWFSPLITPPEPDKLDVPYMFQ